MAVRYRKRKSSDCDGMYISARNGALIFGLSFITGSLLSVQVVRWQGAASSFNAAVTKWGNVDDGAERLAYVAAAQSAIERNKPHQRLSASLKSTSTSAEKYANKREQNQPLPLPKREPGGVKIDRGSPAAFRIYTNDAVNSVALCRFPSSCIDEDGMLYVPQSLKRYRSSIASKCGIQSTRLSFYDPKKAEKFLDDDLTKHHPDVHIASRQRPVRYHMPHLMEDMLHGVFLMAPYLQRATSKEWSEADNPFHPPNTTVYCYEPSKTPLGKRPYACGSDPPRQIGVLAEDRVRNIGWGPGLFNLLGNPTSRAPLQLLTLGEVLPDKQKEHWGQTGGKKYPAAHALGVKGRNSIKQQRQACFGSISVPAAGAFHEISADDLESSVLFQHSGIQRKLPVLQRSRRCSLNVTIINRPRNLAAKVPTSPDARRVTNIKELETALNEEAARLNIDVNIQTREDFAFTAFESQLEEMQRTHSLISIHGAELANMIFLRRGASVTEIYPFRYTPVIFAKAAWQYGLLHHSTIGEPDEEGYKECILHFNKANDKSRTAAEEVVRRFTERARAFRNAKTPASKEALASHWDGGNFVKMIRPCGRNQPLTVDSSAVAKKALQDYEKMCYGNIV